MGTQVRHVLDRLARLAPSNPGRSPRSTRSSKGVLRSPSVVSAEQIVGRRWESHHLFQKSPRGQTNRNGRTGTTLDGRRAHGARPRTGFGKIDRSPAKPPKQNASAGLTSTGNGPNGRSEEDAREATKGAVMHRILILSWILAGGVAAPM